MEGAWGGGACEKRSISGRSSGALRTGRFAGVTLDPGSEVSPRLRFEPPG